MTIPVANPAEIEDLLACLCANRDVCRLRSYAYGLLYDALVWTRGAITEAMLDALRDCLELVSERSGDFGANDFNMIKKKLIEVGFRTAPCETSR